jgi:hypothetical protein
MLLRSAMRPETALSGGGLHRVRVAICLAALGLLLGGCATPVEVRPMATGRSDASAYTLSGADVHQLRREARRLCPLGGEIVREAGYSLPPEADAGRWRSTWNTLSAWVEPPRLPAQLVVVCREGGDRANLQATLAPPPEAHTEPAPAPELSAALPVGPINPEW